MGSGKNSYVNPLNAIPTKWSNTLKKIRRQKQENCVSVFGHCKACQVTPMLFTVERQPKKKNGCMGFKMEHYQSIKHVPKSLFLHKITL